MPCVFPLWVDKQLVRDHYDTELYGSGIGISLGCMSYFHSGVLLRGLRDAFQFPCIKIVILQCNYERIYKLKIKKSPVSRGNQDNTDAKKISAI